jgi:hypothetical protein
MTTLTSVLANVTEDTPSNVNELLSNIATIQGNEYPQSGKGMFAGTVDNFGHVTKVVDGQTPKPVMVRNGYTMTVDYHLISMVKSYVDANEQDVWVYLNKMNTSYLTRIVAINYQCAIESLNYYTREQLIDVMWKYIVNNATMAPQYKVATCVVFNTLRMTLDTFVNLVKREYPEIFNTEEFQYFILNDGICRKGRKSSFELPADHIHGATFFETYSLHLTAIAGLEIELANGGKLGTVTKELRKMLGVCNKTLTSQWINQFMRGNNSGVFWHHAAAYGILPPVA